MNQSKSLYYYSAVVFIMLAFVVASELAMGRTMWGIGNQPGLWTGDAHSPRDSQVAVDPYSLMHISEGAITYGIVRAISAEVPASRIGVLVAGLGSVWEIAENSDFMMSRYRLFTISREYYGDSIVNSIVDILACLFGFYLAWKLPTRVSIVGVIILEVILFIWTRDGLSLNAIMLIHPVEAIRSWQGL